MILNIYYAKELDSLSQLKKFFIENYFFKDDDVLGGKLFDVYFFELSDYQENNNAIDIILIDDLLIAKTYANSDIQLKLLHKWQENKRVVFVALTENYGQMKLWGDEINFIRAFQKEDLLNFLYTEITHDILRFILRKDKLQIFISHAKKDGRNIAKLIKTFIDNDIKLDNFFDETDIQNSSSWKKVLEKNVNDSLFLFVYSDNYGHTVWTQQELIWAKQKQIPIVGIDTLSKEDKRMFPYLGNVKMVKLLHSVTNIEHLCNETFSVKSNHNLRLIINALLKEALEHYLFIDMYQNRQNCKNYKILSRPPELLDVCMHGNQTMLYPDPPLILPEQDILNDCFNNGGIVTPVLLENKLKTNKKIAISISESKDLEEYGISIDHMHMLMVELARYLFIKDNTLLYGGDLGYKSEFNFTLLLVNLLKSYNSNYNEEKKIINFAARPFSKFIDTKIKTRYLDVIDFQEIGEDCELTEIDKVAENLTRMREKITKEMDIKIAVGGKITGYSGFYPGILEEVYLALKADKPTYLIGGFGGMTKKIIKLLQGYDVEELTFDYQKINNEKLRLFIENNPKYEKGIRKKYDEMYNFLVIQNVKVRNIDSNNQIKIYSNKKIYEIIQLILIDISI
ncbi:TIR domain-containing protein [Sulfurovum sp. NBC37-1]|uniref:TIR domain-containing protein n=1 Tax=Sulfurovum sp. (strain NBC37-1) TaxID=387093 RepID=UPI0001587B40|nr:TIR domain-containing protein [Sulfurovum sp. NBC37-1]BAF73052.1 conserved hypothetical protein [Sulfurovum sp. NBC37-1]